MFNYFRQTGLAAPLWIFQNPQSVIIYIIYNSCLGICTYYGLLFCLANNSISRTMLIILNAFTCFMFCVCVCVCGFFLIKKFHQTSCISCHHVFQFLFPLNTMHLLPSCFVFFFFLWTPCICDLHASWFLFIYLFIPSFLWMPCICDLLVSCYLFIYFFLWTPCIWGGVSDTWHHWLILFGCTSYDNCKYDNWS